MKIIRYLAPEPSNFTYAWMPRGSRVVHFGMDGFVRCFWVAMNEKAPADQERKFMVVANDDVYPDYSPHCGTLRDGGDLFHLIEIDPKPFP